MYKFLYCVRFNELEKWDIFDFRVDVGTLYQVVDFIGNLVVYRPIDDIFSRSLRYDSCRTVCTVGLYGKKEVLNG